jgi:hypothetical protein
MLGEVLTAHKDVNFSAFVLLFQERNQLCETGSARSDRLYSVQWKSKSRGPLHLKVGYVTAVAIKVGDHELVTTSQWQGATCT